ncbi:MAG TPA: 16S rRNA methyltransferase [Chloroflexi bacterium]|nr:16S rRNA methyltransferase [Chloroflexota bacterium]HHW87165.1 16S rRNA methyltransferase [Chloroflexota bacterium]
MAEAMTTALVDEIVRTVLASAKYAALDPTLVAEVAAQEVSKGRRRKDAIKEVKTRLHQSVGAYWDGHTNYASWRAALEAVPDDAAQETLLRSIMRSHHSMRERMPFLEHFYRTLLDAIGPVHSVLDLGCGLHPLALPWMALPANALYLACDVDQEQIRFLDWWLAHYHQRGRAFVWNLLDGAPPSDVTGRVDVALLLKLAPCLEQLERGIMQRLLAEVTARVLIVSFPAQSLGGQRKGMLATYTAQMEALLTGRLWRVERFEFPSELVFRVHREIT